MRHGTRAAYQLREDFAQIAPLLPSSYTFILRVHSSCTYLLTPIAPRLTLPLTGFCRAGLQAVPRLAPQGHGEDELRRLAGDTGTAAFWFWPTVANGAFPRAGAVFPPLCNKCHASRIHNLAAQLRIAPCTSHTLLRLLFAPTCCTVMGAAHLRTTAAPATPRTLFTHEQLTTQYIRPSFTLHCTLSPGCVTAHTAKYSAATGHLDMVGTW